MTISNELDMPPKLTKTGTIRYLLFPTLQSDDDIMSGKHVTLISEQ